MSGQKERRYPVEPRAPAVLTVDVGGSHVKAVLNGVDERRRFASGPELTAAEMVAGVLEQTHDWEYVGVSVGVPAPVVEGRVVREPVNLGEGWEGFDFQEAFGKPTKVINDAAMQALGSYEGGRMLFLGLGTGLGTTMILDGVIAPMELGHLPFRKATFEDYVGEAGLERDGPKRWKKSVLETIAHLSAALLPDYIILGGGNARDLGELPPNCRLGRNEDAFLGGFRLWIEDRRSSVGVKGATDRTRAGLRFPRP
jgi:polyphosphate glucokinase